MLRLAQLNRITSNEDFCCFEKMMKMHRPATTKIKQKVVENVNGIRYGVKETERETEMKKYQAETLYYETFSVFGLLDLISTKNV